MYSGYITEIKNIRKHSNADRLMLGDCFGNQVIVTPEITEGQIGVYFPTDGQLGQEFAEKNNLLRNKDGSGGYLNPNQRNIRTLKLRGEISDGLFLPLESLSSFTNINKLKIGEQISVLNSVEICKKYIPEVRKTQSNNSMQSDTKNSFPMFSEHVNTNHLSYNTHAFNVGDVCYITLKMHGTSGRTSYTKKITKTKNNWFKRLITGAKLSIEEKWEYVSGTRRVIMQNSNTRTDYRGDHHRRFVGKLRKGETVYYEIVGYSQNNILIMGTHATTKIGDSAFIKKYGDIMKYTYGCNVGESKVYIYRMTMTTEDGNEVEYSKDMVARRAEQMGMNVVPELDRFIFTTKEDLLSRVDKYTDGEDIVDNSHIREGIVVQIEGRERFTAYKNKSVDFKILEGIMKDMGMCDEEELESLE